jgi:hypothetical protein
MDGVQHNAHQTVTYVDGVPRPSTFARVTGAPKPHVYSVHRSKLLAASLASLWCNRIPALSPPPPPAGSTVLADPLAIVVTACNLQTPNTPQGSCTPFSLSHSPTWASQALNKRHLPPTWASQALSKPNLPPPEWQRVHVSGVPAAPAAGC